MLSTKMPGVTGGRVWFSS